MNSQIDQMTKALLGDQQNQNPMNQMAAPSPTQNGMGTPGMGANSMLGPASGGLLQMLLQGGGPMSLLQMLQGNKRDTDGNPAAAADTPSPGTFTPGGQPNPSSPAVTPF